MDKEKSKELFRYTIELRNKGLTEDEAKELVVIKFRKLTASTSQKIIQLFEKAWSTEDNQTHFAYSDLGNAERFVAEHGRDLMYCPNKWLVWDKKRWLTESRDNIEVQSKAQQTVRRMRRLFKDIEGSDEVEKAAHAHVKYSSSDRGIRAMINQAKSLHEVLIKDEELNFDPWLLNCKNGTLNLKTGELKPHEREDNITKILPVEYDPDARCQRWEEFLYQIMGKNHDLVDFLQRTVGYSLTGDTREECLFLLYGEGANGKTTFIETLKGLFGEYAKAAEFSTFVEKNYDYIRNDIARLKGSRLVVAAESKRGRNFDESLIKKLTGRDSLVARFLYEEHFEFIPEFKIFLAFNVKPKIKGTDYGIWRRIRIVPFNVTFPTAKQDQRLRYKLEKEFPGILAWAVRGCLEWQKNGLNEPTAVLFATKDYKEEMNIIEKFVDEQCERQDAIKESTNNLYHEYQRFCKYLGVSPESKIEFGKQLTQLGIKSKHGRAGTIRIGISLKTTGGEGINKDRDIKNVRGRGKLREQLLKRLEESYQLIDESGKANI